MKMYQDAGNCMYLINISTHTHTHTITTETAACGRSITHIHKLHVSVFTVSPTCGSLAHHGLEKINEKTIDRYVTFSSAMG